MTNLCISIFDEPPLLPLQQGRNKIKKFSLDSKRPKVHPKVDPIRICVVVVMLSENCAFPVETLAGTH